VISGNPNNPNTDPKHNGGRVGIEETNKVTFGEPEASEKNYDDDPKEKWALTVFGGGGLVHPKIG
jgi:hypothetical protein